MNNYNYNYEDFFDVEKIANTLEEAREDTKEKAYWESLEAFWYKSRPAHVEKDWV